MGKATISVVGTGNVGTQLALIWYKLGHNIVNIYGRNINTANGLAVQCDATAISELTELNQNVDIVVLCVSDTAIEEISQKIKLDSAILVHTSGSIPLDALANSSIKYGVYYPIQSIVKTREIDLSTTPICIEASNEQTKVILTDLACSVSNSVHYIDTTSRKQLHLAAVFASNFSNHMFTIAKQLCKNQQQSFELLKPLIEQGLKTSLQSTPEQSQTGPAIRGDVTTLTEHKVMLKQNELYQKIYNLVSQSIKEHHE